LTARRWVLVVGGGNSGFQIAAGLAVDPATGPVTLAVGTRNAGVPQRILGRDLSWWQTRTGLITAPASSRRGRWMRRGDGTVIGHTRRSLRRHGVSFRARLLHADGRTAVFADGTSAEVDAVVWATGFRQDHSWVDILDALAGGRLRHHDGLTPVEGLRARLALAVHRRLSVARIRRPRRPPFRPAPHRSTCPRRPLKAGRRPAHRGTEPPDPSARHLPTLDRAASESATARPAACPPPSIGERHHRC
jgi:cation diffusion facilitator CzcD-associated flavoprotein CzcO